MKSDDREPMGARRGTGPAPWRLYLIIGLVGVSLTGIIGYGFFTAERVNKSEIPLLDAVMVAKLSATRAHHGIEKIMSGASYENLEEIWRHLDQALGYLQDMLEGGGEGINRLSPIEDPGVRKAVHEAREKLADLKKLTWQRLASREMDGAGRNLDPGYFESFNGFMAQVDRVRERLEEIKAESIGRFRTTQWILLAVCVFLTLIIGIAFHGFERRSLADFVAVKNGKDRLEAEIERREELLAELRSFAAIVSHDLRAPLVNLMGFVREIARVLEEIRPELSAVLSQVPENRRKEAAAAIEGDLPEAFEAIDASACRMENMIKAVLRLSRIEERKLAPELLDMSVLVGGVLQSFAYPVKERRIHVSVKPLPEVRADRFAMEQVFANLIGNAVNYLDPARPGEIEISGEGNSDETTFRIRDNGLGIESSDLARIFNMFQRSGGSGVPGEGMGLTYTRALVRRHGGRIWCESKPGEGSTFFISLPVAQAPGNFKFEI